MFGDTSGGVVAPVTTVSEPVTPVLPVQTAFEQVIANTDSPTPSSRTLSTEAPTPSSRTLTFTANNNKIDTTAGLHVSPLQPTEAKVWEVPDQVSVLSNVRADPPPKIDRSQLEAEVEALLASERL